MASLPLAARLLPLALLPSLFCSGLSLAAAEIPPLAVGAGSFTFTDELGNADKPITVWYDRPKGAAATAPVVFVMHGVHRNGREYRDQWLLLAEEKRFLLICPEFSEAAYPAGAYQRGSVSAGSGVQVPKEKWTFSAIEHLFDALKAAGATQAEKYDLYGHSAGAQFVHRLVLFLPEARYECAIAANPGWYTLPTFDEAFPYGLKDSGLNASALDASMRRRFVLLLGAEDTNAADENLRQTPQAEAQGATRLDRGRNFMRKATQAAAAMHVPLAWRSQIVAGAGHSNLQMESAAVALFFAEHPR